MKIRKESKMLLLKIVIKNFLPLPRYCSAMFKIWCKIVSDSGCKSSVGVGSASIIHFLQCTTNWVYIISDNASVLSLKIVQFIFILDYKIVQTCSLGQFLLQWKLCKHVVLGNFYCSGDGRNYWTSINPPSCRHNSKWTFDYSSCST